MPKCIYYLSLLVAVSGFLGACSRPMAYFQKEIHKSYRTSAVEQVSGSMSEPVVNSMSDLKRMSSSDCPTEGYAQNDAQVVSNKPLESHLNHVERMFIAGNGHQESSIVQANRKLNVVERFIVKKLNKRISRQLAPQQPEEAKALSNVSLLIGGVVLLIGGLVLLIAGTGTAAFIGLIIALIGALSTVLGLIGQ